jgi:polysaccharide biosynthesis transport protein
VKDKDSVEYLGYLKAIRERVWLTVLTGGLACLAVIALSLLPTSATIYTARGQLSVDAIAFRTITSQGDELAIAYPEQDTVAWATLANFAQGPGTLQKVMTDLNLEADAEDRYQIKVRVERISVSRTPSAYLEFVVESSDKQVSLKLADALMAFVCRGWQQIRVDDAQGIVSTLQRRLPDAEEDIAKAQAAVRAIEERHGGVAPDREADTIASSLVAVQLALQNADLEATAGRTRSTRLLAQPRRSDTAAQATGGAALEERIDTVRQQVMDRETQLADMLTRRTADHPAVKELRRQIAELKSRVGSLEGAATTGGTSDFVQEAAIEARIYAEEMASRRDVLTRRDNDLRVRLTNARTDVVKYQEAAANAEAVLKRYLALKGNIAAARSEVLNRSRAKMLEVGSKADLDKRRSPLVKLAFRMLLAAFMGVGLGIAVIVGIHYFDATLRNELDAARLLGCPVLAGIPHTDVEVVPAGTTPAAGYSTGPAPPA